MANLSISNDGKTRTSISATQVINAQSLDFDGAVTSNAFVTPFIEVHPTEDCWITFSETPVASAKGANCILLPADVTRRFRVKPGEKIGAIKNVAAGYLVIAQVN